MATVFPNVSRSGGRCSSIQEKAVGETGRSKKTEEWFSQRKSGVGELPEATNESLCEDIKPPDGEDALESFWKTTKRWVCAPYLAVSLLSKVSTVAFLGSVAVRPKTPNLLILSAVYEKRERLCNGTKVLFLAAHQCRR